PEIVSGDFDSIESSILYKFKANPETHVERTPDQDETDFTKAIRILKEKLPQLEADNPEVHKPIIVAFCETSGRFDQVIANIETLYHAANILPDYQVYLMGSQSLTWLLKPPGHHKLICKEFDVRYCSLIPIGSPSIVTTTGLKWNLKNDKLEFGHLVSTSNEIIKDGNKDKI